jgi:hypothetical protein
MQSSSTTTSTTAAEISAIPSARFEETEQPVRSYFVFISSTIETGLLPASLTATLRPLQAQLPGTPQVAMVTQTFLQNVQVGVVVCIRCDSSHA